MSRVSAALTLSPAIVLVAGIVFAQDVPAVGDYVGAGSCQGSKCHSRERDSTEYDVLQTEYTTWLEDAHGTAYSVLINDTSRRIARNLGLGAPTEEQRCVACHLSPGGLLDKEGVSCEACHGAAGGWLNGHARPDWPRARSIERGMIDLRDLEVRAETCLECHLGDATRQVDHQLLAAGHPDLRFELSYYTEASDGAPPHWKYYEELKNKQGRRDTHGVASWAVGQLVALRSGLEQLLRRYADRGWPEFDDLTCETCHHALTPDVSRQSGYAYEPGLPPWNPARWAVLKHLIREVSPAEAPQLEQEMQAIARSATLHDVPREVMQSTGDKAIARLNRLLPTVDQAAYGPARVARLVRAISRDEALLARLDRQTAFQVGLSLDSITIDASQEVRSAVGVLLKLLEDPYTWDRRGTVRQLQLIGGLDP